MAATSPSGLAAPASTAYTRQAQAPVRHMVGTSGVSTRMTQLSRSNSGIAGCTHAQTRAHTGLQWARHARRGLSPLRAEDKEGSDDDVNFAEGGFGKKKKKKQKQKEEEEMYKPSEQVMAENPFFYGYKVEDEPDGPLWFALGWLLKNALPIGIVLFLMIASLAAYLYQTSAGMEFNL
eukprot:CAMPEP_0197516058 /NCGR_PEP_ID=MMETSP1318-20131121/965_1 /TAXON_ID=552666 /ORGANISM="Partenskyella glossopodia, Strain RCC365" /LENGTH=177 /DNA_ID=CAMNT_0043064569 /DNA_START=175 /DNA_END=708 /DNA_ORIENTATION=+